MPKRTYYSRVSPKGQITLPADVRKELKIKPKDSVTIEFDHGVVRIRPKPGLEDFYRKIPALSPPRSWEEVQDIVADEIAGADTQDEP